MPVQQCAGFALLLGLLTSSFELLFVFVIPPQGKFGDFSYVAPLFTERGLCLGTAKNGMTLRLRKGRCLVS